MLTADRVFAVDGAEYGWCEVVVAAACNGAWANAERRARLSAACVEHAAAIGEPLAPGALEAAARAFRYARNLVSAEGMERWLAEWGLSIKDWRAYLRREALRSRRSGGADALLQRYPIAAEEAARLTLVDVICCGELDDWKQSLAGRVAAASSLSASAFTLDADATACPATLYHALPLLNASIDDIREAVRRVQHLDSAFERFRSAQVTDAAVRNYVDRRQLDWVQFDCRVLSFVEEDMAAEAALLLREDGVAFTGVYAAASVEPRVTRFCLEDIPDATRHEFLAAQNGDVLGPMRFDDEYALYLINEKILPSPRDPEVRRRAEEGVMHRALRQQSDRRVRWFADSR